jgi:hypothetical protein
MTENVGRCSDHVTMLKLENSPSLMNCGIVRVMAAQLSAELQQELAQRGDQPIEVVHPGTHKLYVLVAAEIYEKWKQLVGDNFEVPESYPAQDAALSKVWDDPRLDDYAEYDKHRPGP